jgi:hypothetical protein
MSPLAVLTKLAAMLRSVPAVRLVFAKFEALLRDKESGEPLASYAGRYGYPYGYGGYGYGGDYGFYEMRELFEIFLRQPNTNPCLSVDARK